MCPVPTTRTRAGSKTVPHFGEPPRSFGPTTKRQKQEKTIRKSMNNRFDELTKNLARSVAKRGALMKFAHGLGGRSLAPLRAGEPASGHRPNVHHR
jgi:hypothetical protein